jgi:nucleoredoxin
MRSCRRFTPELADVYRALTAAGKPFEIVFISSDRACPVSEEDILRGPSQRPHLPVCSRAALFLAGDADMFMEYSASMPWLSLPYCNRDAKAALSKRFKVSGIPTFVILDAEGGVVNADGRSAVSEDPAGFPWAPKPLSEVLAGPVVRASVMDIAACLRADASALFLTLLQVDASGAARALPKLGFVALYHSASWCGPCREFTPKLVEAYKAVRAAGGELEVVFVSADKNEAAWKDYLSHMPWAAVPFTDEARRAALSDACGVRGIPSLVLLDAATGEIVNPSARAAAEKGRPFPEGWLPPVVLQMNEDDAVISSLNEAPVLCVLAEKAPEAAAAAAEAALAALAPPRGAPKPPPGAEEAPALVIARAEGEVSMQIRSLCGLGAHPSEQVEVLLLDLSSDGAFFTPASKPREASSVAVCEGDVCHMPGAGGVDEAYLRAFLADWRAGKLQPQRVQPGAGGSDEEEDEDE